MYIGCLDFVLALERVSRIIIILYLLVVEYFHFLNDFLVFFMVDFCTCSVFLKTRLKGTLKKRRFSLSETIMEDKSNLANGENKPDSAYTWEQHVRTALDPWLIHTIHEDNEQEHMNELKSMSAMASRAGEWKAHQMAHNVYQVLVMAGRFQVSIDQPLEKFIHELESQVLSTPVHLSQLKLSSIQDLEAFRKRQMHPHIRTRYREMVRELKKEWVQYCGFLTDLYSPALLDMAQRAVDTETIDEMYHSFNHTLEELHWINLTSHAYFTDQVRDRFRTSSRAFPFLGICNDTVGNGWFRFEFPLLIEKVQQSQQEITLIRSDLLTEVMKWITVDTRQAVHKLVESQNWTYLVKLMTQINVDLTQLAQVQPQRELLYSAWDRAQSKALAESCMTLVREFIKNPRQVFRQIIQEYVDQNPHLTLPLQQILHAFKLCLRAESLNDDAILYRQRLLDEARSARVNQVPSEADEDEDLQYSEVEDDRKASDVEEPSSVPLEEDEEAKEAVPVASNDAWSLNDFFSSTPFQRLTTTVNSVRPPASRPDTTFTNIATSSSPSSSSSSSSHTPHGSRFFTPPTSEPLFEWPWSWQETLTKQVSTQVSEAQLEKKHDDLLQNLVSQFLVFFSNEQVASLLSQLSWLTESLWF